MGWLLLVAGFVAAVVLDAWSLSERDAAALPGSTRMMARHAQAVVLAMGFLQLAVTRLLAGITSGERLRGVAAGLLAIGTVVYIAGYASRVVWPAGAWAIPPGAMLNLLGLAVLEWAACGRPTSPEVRLVLAVFLFGMAINVVTGLFAVDPEALVPAYIGSEVGVRQRMLRLARVAAIALSFLTLLFCERRSPSLLGWWGRTAMLVGTLGMPLVLTLACFVSVDFKYLLPIPALAMTAGVFIGLLGARRTASLLEQWGWLMLVVSMSIGLLIGLFAFDGPLPTPEFIGSYNEFTRRLLRLGHAYAIVLGLLAIVLARRDGGAWTARLFVAGNCVTLLAILVLAFTEWSTIVLAAGPALIVAAMLLGIMATSKKPAVTGA
jgi:hypothetical protein